MSDGGKSGRLGRNLGLLYAAEMLGRVAAFAVFPYLASSLGDARYGDLEFAIGVFFILNLVLDAGLAPYGAREAAREPGRTRFLVAQIAAIRFGILLLAVGSLVVISRLVEPSRGVETARLVLAYALVLAPGPFLLNWAFEARDEMHVVAASSLARQLTFAAAVVLLVQGPDDVVRVPVAEAAGLALVVAAQQVLLRKRIGAIRSWECLAGTTTVFRESLPMAAGTIVWALRVFGPLIVLWVLVGSQATGVFGAAHRLVVSAHAFVWLYYVNLLPSMSRLADRPTDFTRLLSGSMRLVGWVALLGAVAGLPLAPLVVDVLYDAEFAAAGPTLALLAWWLALAFISGHHRYALIAVRRPGLELQAALVGFAVSAGGCLWLGRGLEPRSAAMVLVAAEFATLAAAAGFCRRAGLKIPMRPLALPAAATAVAAVIWFIGSSG